MMKKKAQVQSIAPAILALVFAAIVLVFGLVITQALRDIESISTDPGATGAIFNETINSTHGLRSNLNAPNLFPNGDCVGVFKVFNGTLGVPIIAAGNYSVNACVITNLSDTYSNPTGEIGWLVSYNYSRGGEAFVSANKTIAGLATFADFWEIIVLAIVISVVIGLLLVIFGGRGRR